MATPITGAMVMSASQHEQQGWEQLMRDLAANLAAGVLARLIAEGEGFSEDEAVAAALLD